MHRKAGFILLYSLVFLVSCKVRNNEPTSSNVSDDSTQKNKLRLPRIPIEQRTGDKAELNGFPPELLVPIDDFYEKSWTVTVPGNRGQPVDVTSRYSYKGWLFHGDPKNETLIDLIENGPFFSGKGKKWYGPGFYTSEEMGYGHAYSAATTDYISSTKKHDNGIVYAARVKRSSKVNIFNIALHFDHPYIRQLFQENGNSEDKVFPILREKHGIDLIISNYPIVQNADILLGPKDLTQALLDQKMFIEDLDLNPVYRYHAYLQYLALSIWTKEKFGIVAGRVDPEIFFNSIVKIMQAGLTENFEGALSVIAAMLELHSEDVHGYVESYADIKKLTELARDPEQNLALKLVEILGSTYSSFTSVVKPLLIDELPATCDACLQKLLEISASSNNASDAKSILKAYIQKDPTIRSRLIDAAIATEKFVGDDVGYLFGDQQIDQDKFDVLLNVAQEHKPGNRINSIRILKVAMLSLDQKDQFIKSLFELAKKGNPDKIRKASSNVLSDLVQGSETKYQSQLLKLCLDFETDPQFAFQQAGFLQLLNRAGPLPRNNWETILKFAIPWVNSLAQTPPSPSYFDSALTVSARPYTG